MTCGSAFGPTKGLRIVKQWNITRAMIELRRDFSTSAGKRGNGTFYELKNARDIVSVLTEKSLI